MNASSTNETISTTKDFLTDCARSLRYGLSLEPPPLTTTHAILVILGSPQSNNRTAGVPNHVQFGIQAIFGILGGPKSNDRTAGVPTHVQFGLYGDFRNSWQATVLCSDCRIRHSCSDAIAVFSGLQVVSEILSSQNSYDRTAGLGGRKGGFSLDFSRFWKFLAVHSPTIGLQDSYLTSSLNCSLLWTASDFRNSRQSTVQRLHCGILQSRTV